MKLIQIWTKQKILTWALYRFSESWRSVSFLVCPFLLFFQESQSARTRTFKQKDNVMSKQCSALTLIGDNYLTLCRYSNYFEVIMYEDSHLSRNISSSWKQTSRTSSDSFELIFCASLGIAWIHLKRNKKGNNINNIEHKQVNQNPFSWSLIITPMVLI